MQEEIVNEPQTVWILHNFHKSLWRKTAKNYRNILWNVCKMKFEDMSIKLTDTGGKKWSLSLLNTIKSDLSDSDRNNKMAAKSGEQNKMVVVCNWAREKLYVI